MKTYEFCFRFVGDGDSQEEALRDAIEAVQTALATRTLEPSESILLKQTYTQREWEELEQNEP